MDCCFGMFMPTYVMCGVSVNCVGGYLLLTLLIQFLVLCEQVIEGLDGLVNLESLFLGKNKITKLQVSFSVVC